MKNIFFYDFPIGKMSIAEEDGAVCRISFGEDIPSGFETAETTLIASAAAQLTEYFAGRRTEFDFPLSLHGTDFQREVWAVLRTIPFGEVRSYKDIAKLVGRPKAYRAVGMANHRNPIAIVVPCHRVTGQSGSLVGYAAGLEVKKYLLALEKVQ